MLQIYLVSLRFCEPHTFCRVAVDISFFQLQQLPEFGAPSCLLMASQNDLFLEG
jgi:hypothetical protein